MYNHTQITHLININYIQITSSDAGKLAQNLHEGFLCLDSGIMEVSRWGINTNAENKNLEIGAVQALLL